MQQQTSYYFKYGISIGFMALILLIYQIEFNNKSQKTNPQKAEADFFINDQPQQQQHFNISTFNNASSSSLNNNILNNNETILNCSCYSTENITLVRHGENQPVFVPEDLSPMQPDILDKIYANRLEKQDNGILVTVAGYAMRNELYNWITLLKDAKEKNYIIFCTDLPLYIHLIVSGYEDKAVYIPDDWFMGNDVDLFRNITTSMLDKYPRLSHIKTLVLQRLVYISGIQNILYLDVNQIVLHARTREYIQTLMHIRWDTQIIATQDTTDQHTVNTGLIMIRSNAAAAKRLLASTIQIQEMNTQLSQQQAFNMALDQLNLNLKSGNTVLLDIMHFPNGINYFEKNLSISKGIKPYIVHVNHKFGKERIGLLQKYGFWKVNQEYVDAISNQVENMIQRRQEAELQEVL